MEQSADVVPVPAAGGTEAVDHRLGAGEDQADAGFPKVTGWLRQHWVTVAAMAIIAIQLSWKASFIGHFYFRQDDFHFTEIALHSSLGWKYLSYVGSGHLHPGVLLIIWILARTALYNWSAASAVTLVMLAVASLAAWRLLRTLMGDRAAILIPLLLYLITPLTIPNDSWWQSAIESLPLQAVIFLALTAHVYYVRTGRVRHLVAAAAWLAVGLFFFEKAAVIPVVLFGVTAGFLLEGRITATVVQSLVRYWRAWLVYAVMVAAYGAVLLDALHSSTVKPSSASLASTFAFSGDLLKDTLLPGLIGGPWNWYFLPPQYGQAVAYAAPSSQIAWLSVLVVAGVVVASIMTRTRAWRAWAILGCWVLLADIVPVLLGRVSSFGAFAGVFALDTRYVADAAAVAAICLALAFWPVARPDPGGRGRRPPEYFASQTWRVAGLVLTCVLVVGSIWSVNSYENATRVSDFLGRYYLINARASLSVSLPRDTVIVDRVMPYYLMWEPAYQNEALQSAAIGPMASTPTARAARWVLHPQGTIDNLGIFAPDGSLRRATVSTQFGGASRRLPADTCWPVRKGRIIITFSAPPSAKYTDMLEIAYYSGASVGGRTITVSYGSDTGQFVIQPDALNDVFVRVAGTASEVVLSGVPSVGLCIGSVNAGFLAASAYPLAAGAAK